MAKSLQAWKDQVYNKTFDLDNQSYDCVDVSKHWIVYLTDVAWQQSAGWGNAKDIYSYWSDKYLEKIPRGNAPKLGDIVVMNGSIGGGFGHTGVVVAINGQNITIYQQNTFTQQPVYQGVYNAYVSYITGFLRPKVAFSEGAEAPLQGFQRKASYAAKYREAANSAATILQTFVAGDTYDFKGFVRGEPVDGNDIWFVGRYSGGYVWSGAFDDKGTHDLPDLTPATQPALQGFQRVVGNSVINYREKPELQPDNVLKTFNPGEILDFDAFTRGTLVDGNDIWFRGKYTGGWSHSGGFTDTGTHDLEEVKLEEVSTPVTPPTDNTSKVLDLSSHNKIVDYQKLKDSVRGVITKAGHTGKSYGGVQPDNSDPTFLANKTGLGDKLVGAYWYGYASLDAESEAGAFVKTVGVVPSSFTYWLDIEETDSKSNAEVNEWCKTFCETVDYLTNKVTGLYMNRNWYDNVITSEVKGTRPMWIAHYDIAENTSMVANQVAHQYTSKGSAAGVEGYVDINAVTDSFFKPTVIVPPVVPVDPTTPVEPTPIPEPQNPVYDVNFIVAFFNALVKFIRSFRW